MRRPALKPFYRVFRIEGERQLFIGLGPDKFVIDEPDEGVEEFLARLDGSSTRDDLAARFPDTDDWLAALDEAGVIEDRDVPPPLDADIAARWSRQINWLRLFERPGWSGFEAQGILAGARVVVVGTGAGGTTLLRLLNAAGIGTLEAVEFDSFALDNLPTHTTLDEADVGRPKLEALQDHMRRQNAGTRFVTHSRRLESADELAGIVAGADFFCQAFDRPRQEAARWTNAAGLRTGVPFGSIGVTDRGARAGPVVVPGSSPCWDCVGLPDLEFVRLEETAALLGATVAMLAGILVTEMIKVVTGAAPSALVGRSLYIDTGTLEFHYTDHPRRADCHCMSPAAVAP